MPKKEKKQDSGDLGERQEKNRGQKGTAELAKIERQIWRKKLKELASEQAALIREIIGQAKELSLRKPYGKNTDTSMKFSAFAESALFNASVSEKIYALEGRYADLLTTAEKYFVFTPVEAKFLSGVEARFKILQTKQNIMISITQMIASLACANKYQDIVKTIDSDYAKLTALTAQDNFDSLSAQRIRESLMILDKLDDVVKGLAATDDGKNLYIERQQALDWRNKFSKKLITLLEGYHGRLKALVEQRCFLTKDSLDVTPFDAKEDLGETTEWGNAVEELNELENAAEKFGLNLKNLADESNNWLMHLPERFWGLTDRENRPEEYQDTQLIPFQNLTASVQKNDQQPQFFPFDFTQMVGDLDRNQANQSTINLDINYGVNEINDEENLNTVRFVNK